MADTIIPPRYPQIKVPLTGYDGNAFAILGRVIKAMRKHGVGDAEVKRFQTEAMSGDYDHLLATAMRWWPCHDRHLHSDCRGERVDRRFDRLCRAGDTLGRKGDRAMMKLLALMMVVVALPAQAATKKQEDAAACIIGHAVVALNKQKPQKDACVATEAALAYANKRCRQVDMGDGGDNFIYHSIKVFAVTKAKAECSQ